MKNKILMFLIPVLCLTIGTGRSVAKDEGLYALGGFIGGVLTTKAFDRHHHQKHYSCSSRHQCQSHCNRCNQCQCSCQKHKPKKHGHYEIVTVKVWIPGCWKTKYDRCGRRVQYQERGHYEYRKERVWVSSGRSGGHSNGRSQGHSNGHDQHYARR